MVVGQQDSRPAHAHAIASRPRPTYSQAMQNRHRVSRHASSATCSGTATSTRAGAGCRVESSSVPPTASSRSLMLIRPSPLPQAASTSNPTPSSAMVSDERGRAARQVHATRGRAALYLMAFCSASWTIRNRHSVTSGGSAGGTCSCVNVDRESRLRQLALQALEGRDQADQPQLRRMQAVRQIVHASARCPARGSTPRRPALIGRLARCPAARDRSPAAPPAG